MNESKGGLSYRGSKIGGDWVNESVGTPMNVSKPLLVAETPKIPGAKIPADINGAMNLDDMKCLSTRAKAADRVQ